MVKNKALAHHTSTYFHTRRVSKSLFRFLGVSCFQGISRYFDATGKPSSNWSRRPVPSTNLQPLSLTVPSRPVIKIYPVVLNRPVPSRKSLSLEFIALSRRDIFVYYPVPSRHPNLHRCLYRPVQPTKLAPCHPRFPSTPSKNLRLFYEFRSPHWISTSKI